jgi:hypothetical protein
MLRRSSTKRDKEAEKKFELISKKALKKSELMQQAVKERQTKYFSRQQHKFMKTTDQTGGLNHGEEPTLLD